MRGARYAVPAIYDFREYAAAGSLMSYGTFPAAFLLRADEVIE